VVESGEETWAESPEEEQTGNHLANKRSFSMGESKKIGTGEVGELRQRGHLTPTCSSLLSGVASAPGKGAVE